MGLIQSVFCSITFCLERVLTWTCCAFVLMLLMFTIIILMIYGVSVGYHYSQKELAAFAKLSRTTTQSKLRQGPENVPVVRLIAGNHSEVEHAPQPILDYNPRTPEEPEYIETSETTVEVSKTEGSPEEPKLSPRERELARRLIGRFRRSRSNITSVLPFLRPLTTTTYRSTDYNTSDPVTILQHLTV